MESLDELPRLLGFALTAVSRLPLGRLLFRRLGGVDWGPISFSARPSTAQGAQRLSTVQRGVSSSS